MRYTICGFSQARLIELGFDDRDALILRYFVDFKDAGGMVKRHFDSDEPFYWIQYDGFLEEYPILKKGETWSKDTVYRRLKKMADKNVLQHRTSRKGGTFSYYAIGKEYYSLISDSNPKGTDSNPKGTDSNPKGTDSNPKGTDSNPKGTDSNPKGTDSNPEQKIHLLQPSTTSHTSHPSAISDVCMSAPPKIETTEIPEKSNQQIDLNECDVCDVKDFAEKPQSERLQILESIFNADCRKRGKSEIRISQILKYIIGKHGVTESVIFEAIQRITTANYKIRESLYAFLVTNREERIFHNGKCVFAPRKEEPTDADTLAPIKAIEKRQSKKPATPITDAEFEALNKKLKEKHAA